jgi:recombination protein RecT
MSTELERRLEAQGVEQSNGAPTSIAQLIEKMRPELERAMPAYFNADRLMRIALTELRRNEQLQRCSAASLLGAIVMSAQVGLEPGPMKQVYLIPKTIDGVLEVLWLPSYRGKIALMYRSGLVASINGAVVWRGEHFLYREGDDPKLEHEPRIDLIPTRDDFVAAYIVAKLSSGELVRTVIGQRHVDRALRASALGPDRGPWKDDYEAMLLKTALHRAEPFIPSSAEVRMASGLDGAIAPHIEPGRPIPRLEDIAPAEPDIIDEPRTAPPPARAAHSSVPGAQAGPSAPAAEPVASSPHEPAVGPDGAGELVAFFARHDQGKTYQGKLTPSLAKGYLERGEVDERRDAEDDLTAVIVWAVCKRRSDIPGRSGTLGTANKGDLRIEALAGDEEQMAELLVARLAVWYETAETKAVAWLENVRAGAEENAAVAAGFRPVAERIPGIWLYVLEPPTPAAEQAAPADAEAAAAARSSLTLHVAGLLDLCPQSLFERLSRAMRRYGLTPDVTSLAAKFPELADARDLEGLVARLEGAEEFRGFIDEQGQSQERLP